MLLKQRKECMNGYKYSITWWILYGIPLIILSFIPRRLKEPLYKKYSKYGNLKKD